MYGVGQQPTDEFGRNCLVARRLVERGVRFVQLYSGGGHLEDTWDAHESIEKNHGQHAAEVDQPIAALLTDLERRGLLESTLVVWGGEFGRMPFSEGEGRAGPQSQPLRLLRCGWPAAASRAASRTARPTSSASRPSTNKVHLHDLHATILPLMGLDHERLTYFHQGRDERLTDVFGNVIHEIIA